MPRPRRCHNLIGGSLLRVEGAGRPRPRFSRDVFTTSGDMSSVLAQYGDASGLPVFFAEPAPLVRFGGRSRTHSSTIARYGLDAAMSRPMISFMISVVPPYIVCIRVSTYARATGYSDM